MSDLNEDQATRGLPDPDTIVRTLRESTRGPMKLKDLARTLAVSQNAYRDFRERLREMERQGTVVRTKGIRYAVPDRIQLIVGTLQFTRSGDAFLRPERRGERDLFVPVSNQESGMDGDRVAARIEERPRGRAPVGRVVKILERAHPTVVGTFHPAKGFGVVRPLDPKVSREVLIPESARSGASPGDVVVVRITRFGDRRVNTAGEVERILGPIEDPGVDVLAILYGHGLRTEFPEDVERSAGEGEAELARPGRRSDLRALHVFTIDPADAKDHDDALSIESIGEGLWEVGIHIADVSHFVPEGSPVDLEAYRRGTSVYLVDQVVPMLPHRLSSDLCSLKMGVDRLAVSLFVHLDEEGRVREHRFERSLIRCAHSLNYDQVQELLEGTRAIDPRTDEALRILDRLAKALRTKRRARGSLDFDLPEARVLLDADGIPIDILRSVQKDAHRLIEDFMILANEVVAQASERRKLPIPFRVHEPPSTDKGEELRAFLASVGHPLPKGKLLPSSLQAVLDQVEGRPEAALISTVILRSMARARYDPDNSGHFGLASTGYAHFTSPIRRYPDLALHRVVVHSLIEGRSAEDRWDREYLESMTAQASERERVAQKAERDSIELKKVEFMQRHLGADFEGTISGVTSFGLFVLLDRYFVEGLVHVGSLGDDYYVFSPEAYTLAGSRSKRRFRLGDRLRVQVARVSKEERRIDFVLLRGKGEGR